jgi:hypothetical protein
MTVQLSPAQLAYRERLDAIEAEKLAALNTPGAKAERLAIIALRKMSAALVKLRAAQREGRS